MVFAPRKLLSASGRVWEAKVRHFRFGVVYSEANGLHWADQARRVESEGFSTLLICDHYVAPMACGPLIMAAASATTALRVGSYVYNNDFRHPALLAKEVATIDVLSDGRMELGMGAGWVQSEYEAVGLRFDQPRIRAERFEEAVDVVGLLLAGQKVTHQGGHYQLEQFQGAPRPTQQKVPLLIGGGAPRMIRLAARRADIAAFVPRTSGGSTDPGDLAPNALDEKVGWLETEIRRCGRHDEPERSVLLFATSSSLDGPRCGCRGLRKMTHSLRRSLSSAIPLPWSILCWSGESGGGSPITSASVTTSTP